MNVKHPPAQPRNFGRPSEELDGLLYAFMRAEVPDPWPMMKAPAQPTPATLPLKTRRWPRLSGSRLALAATVTLCLVGSLMLTHLFPGDSLQGRDKASTEMIAPRNTTSPLTSPPKGNGWKSFTDETPTGLKVKGYEKGNLKKGFTIRLEPEPEE
jgi:hypothetical protein